MRLLSQGTTSVAANATNKNVLSGETYERLPFDCMVFVGLAASATGLLINYLIGGMGVGVNIAPSLINRTPTGGALTLFWNVEYEELIAA